MLRIIFLIERIINNNNNILEIFPIIISFVKLF